jgi:hypothetical protein
MNTKYQDQSLSNNPFGTLLSKLETETPPTGSATFSNKQLANKGVRRWKHTPEQIAQAFRYENGKLYHKKPGFGRQVHKPAGSLTQDGYITVCYEYEAYKAHRVIWCLHYGYWPAEQIDHINGVRHDNRLENLREATILENRIFISKNNTSGIVGVSWHSPSGKWQAHIKINYKHINLGYFASKNLAIAARKAAEVKYSFPVGE